MAAGPLDRIRSAADLLRPRTFFRTLSRVDPLVDATRELTTAVQALRVQTEQLMAIQRLDWDKREELLRLDRELDATRIEAHVSAAVASATLERDPFPHILVRDWLPPDVYRRVVEAIPPSVFFADREASKQRLMVPFTFAPEYSRRVWAFVAETIVAGTLRRALSGKFQQDIAAHLSSACGTLPDDLEVTLHPSDGRIMLRRPGYDLKPHRDPKWGFVTGLVYLPREGDVETHGTRLYRVRDDADAPDGNVFYIAPERCQLVKTVPFRANTLLAFVNSSGAHSASIPADAPRDLERYLYQFRLGPTSAVIKRLLQLMPPEKASMWAGGKTARAAN